METAWISVSCEGEMITMILAKAWWFGVRWQVYLEQDGTTGPWLAEFRTEIDAMDYIRWKSRPENYPCL